MISNGMGGAGLLLLAGGLLGLGLGWLYFGGLWWTLQRLPQRDNPTGWLLLSFAVRGLMVLLAFGVMMRFGTVPLWAAAFCAFVVARFGATRLWGRLPA